MKLPLAHLEEWMRRFYFAADVDIGSSGVEDFSLAELRRIAGIEWSDLDALVFHDSQTLGGPPLRQAIAERWTGGDAGRVMATHGSSEASFLIMNALLSPGDEVVVLDPCYPQLYLIAQAIGCRIVRWPLHFRRGFRPDLEEGLSRIGPQTRMVVVNFPHNPTGASLDPVEQAALIDAADRFGVYLVWDNAFGEVTYEAPPLYPPNLLSDRVIETGTLSKSYGLPGLRVGWCLAPPEILQRLARVRDYLTLHLSPLVERLAAGAIAHADDLLALRLPQVRANLATVAAWCEAQEGVDWAPPRGGVCVFPRLNDIADVDAFCERLGTELGVLLVPGSCFGHPAHVRLGFGGASERLAEGLARLSRALPAGVGAGSGSPSSVEERRDR